LRPGWVYRGLREIRRLAGSAEHDAVEADLWRAGAADLGCNTLQPGLVAIGPVVEDRSAAARLESASAPADADARPFTAAAAPRICAVYGLVSIRKVLCGPNSYRLAGLAKPVRGIGLILTLTGNASNGVGVERIPGHRRLPNLEFEDSGSGAAPILPEDVGE